MSGRIAGVARAQFKLCCGYDEISDAGIVQCIGFADAKAIAERCVVGHFLHAHRGAKLGLEDNSAVFPEVDNVTVGIVTEKVTFAFVVPLP